MSGFFGFDELHRSRRIADHDEMPIAGTAEILVHNLGVNGSSIHDHDLGKKIAKILPFRSARFSGCTSSGGRLRGVEIGCGCNISGHSLTLTSYAAFAGG